MKIIKAKPTGRARRILGGWRRGQLFAVLVKEISEATNDLSIDLDKAFDSRRTGQKAFNDTLRLALGISRTNVWGKVEFAPEFEEIFRSAGSTKSSKELKTAEAVRANFAHDLKFAAQVAAGLIDMRAEVKVGNEPGTLLISGSEVAVAFNQRSVVLKPKQTHRRDDGNTAWVSFTRVAELAAASRAVSLPRRLDSRRAVATVELLCGLLQNALTSRGRALTSSERVALKSVATAARTALAEPNQSE
jgi:hypothetical protein